MPIPVVRISSPPLSQAVGSSSSELCTHRTGRVEASSPAKSRKGIPGMETMSRTVSVMIPIVRNGASRDLGPQRSPTRFDIRYKGACSPTPPVRLRGPVGSVTLLPMDIPQERKLVTEVPGPKSTEWFVRRTEAVPTGVANLHPVVTARASGAIVEDVDGNRLIDLATGISVLNVGLAAPEVVAAVQRQVDLDTHTCFHVTANEPYIELAERLNALAPIDGPAKTMFANAGAEAVENAVKIARKATGRPAIVAFDHAFHGRTLMGMTLTAKVMPYKQGMGPFAPEVYRLPFAYPYRWPSGPEHCADEALAYALDEMHKHIGEENIAAVILEPIQGEGGFIVPAPGFVKGIADFCGANGIVFIADEIQSGMGRAGRWFTIVDEGVQPDIVLSAKSLGGGLPISAITGRADLMDGVHVGGLGGTYGGNPIAAAAALAVLDKIEREQLLDRSVRTGESIMARF